MKYFDHVIYNYFKFFFIIKNKWQLHTIYAKRELPLKIPRFLFLRAPSQEVRSLTSKRDEVQLMQSKLFKSQVGNCFQPNLVQEDQIYHLSLCFFGKEGVQMELNLSVLVYEEILEFALHNSNLNAVY